MANINVLYDGLFIATPGLYREALSLDSPTLERVIQAMAEKYGERFKETLYDQDTGKVATGVTILVNGSLPTTVHSPLNDADEVAFLFPIVGGSPMPPKEDAHVQ